MAMNAYGMLDIHTHEFNSDGKAIINYPLLVDSSYDKLLADSVEVAVYSAGIHPWELVEENVNSQLGSLEELLAKEQFVAVGEAGLDKLASASMELQTAVFKKQIELSERLGLPLIIHCVKAMDELLALKKKLHPVQPWIWHGFRGKPDQAKQLLLKGFYLSFGAHYPEESMNAVPENRLFIETDNSHTGIEELLQRAAEVRGVKVGVLREAIRKNIEKVFFKG